MTKASSKQTEPALQSVTLIKPHTHRGKPLGVGDSISVTAAKAEWLAAQGVINPLSSTATPVASKTTEQETK